MSRYTYGPMGLISRLAQEENSCANDDCTEYYLNDATGSCQGVYDTHSASAQYTRMDAWGNLIAPIFIPEDGQANSLPTATLDCSGESTACASTQPATLDKAQVLAGPYQYHGCQGYESDVIDPQRNEAPRWDIQTAPDMGRSTGFMHVGCRYYEPATGRFLEYDPMPADPTPMSWGQTNRWAYCANDPANAIDATGNFIQLIGITLLVLAAGLMIASYFATGTTAIILGVAATIVGLIGTLLLLGPAIWAAAAAQLDILLAGLSAAAIRALACMMLYFASILGNGNMNACTMRMAANITTVDGLKNLISQLFR